MVKMVGGKKEMIRSAIRESLQFAADNMYTEKQRTELIQKTIKDVFSEIKGSARSIARTEMHSAFSNGRWEAAKSLNPDEIEWVSSRDSNVRDSHHHLDGKTVKLGDKFENGCRYPLDPAGGPGEVVNCRCSFSAKWRKA
jgi:SPP1 gp7 family putative phage head morphogenesis protein